MFIKIAAQVLLGAGAFLHTPLIGAEQLAPLPGLGVRLPDFDRQAAQVDPRDLGGIELVIGQVALADLPGAVALQDDHLPAQGAQPFGDREGVRTRLDQEDVVRSGVPRGPDAEGGQGLPRHAVHDAGAQRIAPLQDGGGEAVRMDVQTHGAAWPAEGGWRIGGLH